MSDLVWINKQQPHKTHKMSEWKSEIRCPGDTPRFYAIRQCLNCTFEEGEHPAGHYMEPELLEPCEYEK